MRAGEQFNFETPVDRRGTASEKWDKYAWVGFSDGSPFGASGFVRLNFGCQRLLLTEALQRMQAAVAGV